MKTVSLSGLMLAALLAGSASLQAAPGNFPAFPPMDMPMIQPGPPPPQGPMMPDVQRLEKAGATEEQIQAYSDFWYEQQVKRISLRAASETADIELDHLLQTSPTDDAAIQEAIDAVNEARGALFKLDILSRITTKQILGEKTVRALCEQNRPPCNPPQGPRACLLKAPPAPQEIEENDILSPELDK